jgi:thiamine-phosphate pyrophosphorylase
LRGLYLITPDEPDTDQLLQRVEALLEHATLLQYRNKAATRARRREQVEALLPLCRRHGVPLIVNDDWRLALDAGADGAHLGRDDGELQRARRDCGVGAILGASCYGELERARHAVGAGASYVAFGAFFPSPTKPDASRASMQLLRTSASLEVPRVAIGGIRAENVPSLVAAGADLVAVISGVFDAQDPESAARAYRAGFD